jgi:methyl-accepting chemotaxis protein
MKNLSISRQLIVLVVALMAAFSVATFYQLKSATDAIYEERYGMLRTQVQSAISILQSFHDREKAGDAFAGRGHEAGLRHGKRHALHA